MQKSIAFFDFDGTITNADSMLEMVKFTKGNLYYWFGMILILPWLIAMKFGLISKQSAKEKLLTYFFGNTPISSFNNWCTSFNEKIMPALIKKDAMAAIQYHLNKNTHVIIVTASAEHWIAPWCRQYNIDYICTILMVKDDKITGKLKGNNCSGKEKASLIKERFNLADYTSIYCYGDTSDDEPMLQLATNRYYRAFNK